MDEFAEQLKITRKNIGLTLQRMSELTDIRTQMLSDLENSRRKPGLRTLRRIGKLFGEYGVDPRIIYKSAGLKFKKRRVRAK